MEEDWDDDEFEETASEIIDDEMSYDFTINDSTLFDHTAFVDMFPAEPEPAVTQSVVPKLHTLRYGTFKGQHQRFVSNIDKKPSRVSQEILSGLADLEDLYDNEI